MAPTSQVSAPFPRAHVLSAPFAATKYAFEPDLPAHSSPPWLHVSQVVIGGAKGQVGEGLLPKHSITWRANRARVW